MENHSHSTVSELLLPKISNLNPYQKCLKLSHEIIVLLEWARTKLAYVAICQSKEVVVLPCHFTGP